MYFRDTITSNSDWTQYEALLRNLSEFVQDCVSHALKAYRVVEQAGAGDGKYYHATAILLVRHLCEFIDGVSVLVARGCSEPCKPLLRSAFEAQIGLLYILEGDTERRALAYQVAHAHYRMKLFRKMKEDDQAGKELRKLIESDPVHGQVRIPKEDWQSGIDNMERLLARPEYEPIEQEWRRAKKAKGREPPWFELFGGPSSVRDLAHHLKKVFSYEFLYRQWSTAVHAGGCLENIAADNDGNTVVRPIRHPDGLQALVSFAASMCLELSRRLVAIYAPEQSEAFAADYVANLRQRHLEVSDRHGLIRAPWK